MFAARKQPVKKTRIIIIGLGIALLCTALLYGAFAPHATDMINASGGQLDIDITNAEIGYVSDYIEISPSSVVVKNDNKTVQIGVHNLYASSETNVSIEITNTGVLPIKFIWIRQDIDEIVDMKIDKPVDIEPLRDLNIQYDLYRAQKNGEYSLRASESVSITDESMRAMDGTELVFQPGESILLDVKITVSSDSSQDFEHKSFLFSVTPFFTQAF